MGMAVCRGELLIADYRRLLRGKGRGGGHMGVSGLGLGFRV